MSRLSAKAARIQDLHLGDFSAKEGDQFGGGLGCGLTPTLDPREGGVVYSDGGRNLFKRLLPSQSDTAKGGVGGCHLQKFCTTSRLPVKHHASGELNSAQNVSTMRAMHPGPNIRKLRKAKDWNLERLAQETERFLGKPINTGNLSRLEREAQGYSNELLQSIARALEVPVGDLFSSLSDSVPLPAFPVPPREGVLIPRFENPAGMGRGIERHEADLLVGHMTVNAEWIRQNLPGISSPKNLNIMVAAGDSMSPTINDGDLVLIDRGVRELHLDAIYVFRMGDELYIKTLQRMPGESIRVISDNKKYEPFNVGAADRQELEVLARVVYAWNGVKL